MTNTPNYNLNIVEGTDYVNPLTQTNPNFETIDTEMKRNADNSVTLATELKTGTVHALVRANPSASTFRFVATSDFNVGDTFTVDGTQVTALQTTGQPLTDKSFVINANVLCVLTGTVLTLFVQGGASKAEDSDKLGGQLPNYYATAVQVEDARQSAISAGEVANEALNKTRLNLLWTNPNPSSNFEIQDVLCNINNHNIACIRFKASASSAIYIDVFFIVDENLNMASYYLSADKINRYARSFNLITNGIHFGEGLTNEQEGKSSMIPYKIYGIN